MNTEEAKTRKTKVTRYDVLSLFINYDSLTIPQIAKEMDLTLPTVTKLINKLIDECYIINNGKTEGVEGRPPKQYTINPEIGFFIGVDLKHDYIRIGLVDFSGKLILAENIKYKLYNSLQSLDELCNDINGFIKRSSINSTLIINIQINISGRVNPQTGISHTMFSFLDDPISEVLEYKLGHHVTIENDTRAMLYGEIYKGCIKKEKEILYINIGWGLGAGIIVNGQMVEGKSGFSGEFGHFYAYDNEILCRCGKKGCLETEVSGSALYRKYIEEIKSGKQSILSNRVLGNNEDISLEDIINATLDEDLLCIDLVEDIATKLGKQVANLINLLNPELIIIGGSLAKTGDYLMLPLKAALNKYTLNLVHKDATIRFSDLTDEAGIIGACYLARNNYIKKLQSK